MAAPNQLELHLRSVRSCIELLATASPGAEEVQIDDVVGAVCPAASRRGIANSVLARDADSLLAVADELDSRYSATGVEAWCAWLPPRADPDPDADGAVDERALAERGIVPDGSPIAMRVALERVPPEPRAPAGYELADDGSPAALGRLNDLAYGYSGKDSMAPALAEPPASAGLHLYEARSGGEAVATAGFIDVADPISGALDSAVVFVATDPAHGRRGLASAVMARGLRAARERGCATSSLQASGAGEPVYARLGYTTDWRFAIYERRFG
ncbi:GNAT family N-acetyltransferase [Thermoleophilia bacterium SCSIO 60948]|nr:GNAT family N-acetyltransferase [Thermoleophilia bacterium SCSIO 60948]